MVSFAAILSALLPVFLVIATGAVFHRRGWLNEETETGMMKLGINLLAPFLILTLVPGNPALERMSTAAWTIGIGFVAILCGFAMAWGLGRLFRLKYGEGLRTFAISSGIQNYGFFALPILIDLFPGNSGPSGLCFVLGIGIDLAIWTVGVAILTGKAGLRALLNAPFITVICALILNYTGVYHLIPGILSATIDMLGRCAVPMALFMIGSTIGRLFREGITEEIVRVGAASILTRFGFHAAMLLLIALFLPLPLSLDLRRLLIVQAAMPSAVFPIVLARLYGGQPRVATQVVLVTSLASFLFTPLIIAWGLERLGP